MDDDVDRRLAAWMRKAQGGDRQAYETLLNEIQAILRSFVRKQLPRSEWVEDVVQETLISIHRDRHTYDPGRPFSSWMFAIARHRTIDFVRKQRQQAQHERLAHDHIETSVVVKAPEGMSFERLHRAMRLISGKQREVIQLLKWSELSVREVALHMGMSEASVKVNAHRGYKNLRKLLAGGLDED